MPEYRYRYGDRSFSVSLERLASGDQRAVIREGDSQTTLDFTVEQGGGEWRLRLDDGQYRALVSSKNDGREIWLNGFTYRLEREQERAGRVPGGGSTSGHIEAQMPGLVRDVLVQTGDQVERGQTLVILEAMKMEMRAPAPFDGVVKQVSVSKGEIVTRGQVLVEIE